MVFKRFYFIILIRILVLVASIFLFVFLVTVAKHEVSSIILGLLIVFQIYLLINFVNRTNNKLIQFFNSIKYSDFSSSFSDKSMGKSFEKLSASFNEVIEEFKKHRAEKEENYNYLQTVVQHVNIGIICFDSEGNVDLYNNAAKSLLKSTRGRREIQRRRVSHKVQDAVGTHGDATNHVISAAPKVCTKKQP